MVFTNSDYYVLGVTGLHRVQTNKKDGYTLRQMPTGINVCDIEFGYAQFAFNKLLDGMEAAGSVGFDADLFGALADIDFDFKILKAGKIYEQLSGFFGSLELDATVLETFMSSHGFTNFIARVFTVILAVNFISFNLLTELYSRKMTFD